MGNIIRSPMAFNMKSFTKFLVPNQTPVANFYHSNIWERQDYPGWSRLAIGAKKREVGLLLDLCKDWDGPFDVLYVLSVPRTIKSSGRFQSAHPINYDDLELFLYSFQEFFEQDGRHDIWVVSLSSQNQLILDRHNNIYAYGDLTELERKLKEQEFSHATLETPLPHAHHYHSEYDSAETEVLEYWDWIKSELHPSDDP
ncbi:MAG: hypothetical protein COB16_02145 [Rhodobacteraceae bacterium]|nr:MAG: hypothetical protein COB16_02145 [Paracoccaceae bacterium]